MNGLIDHIKSQATITPITPEEAARPEHRALIEDFAEALGITAEEFLEKLD